MEKITEKSVENLKWERLGHFNKLDDSDAPNWWSNFIGIRKVIFDPRHSPGKWMKQTKNGNKIKEKKIKFITINRFATHVWIDGPNQSKYLVILRAFRCSAAMTSNDGNTSRTHLRHSCLDSVSLRLFYINFFQPMNSASIANHATRQTLQMNYSSLKIASCVVTVPL